MNTLKRLFLLVAITVASSSFAQTSTEAIDYGSATVSSAYCIELDDSQPIQEYYVASASSLGWSSVENAAKMCGFHRNNLITLQEDYANGNIIIRIHTDRTYEPRDIIWWNNYLQGICE